MSVVVIDATTSGAAGDMLISALMDCIKIDSAGEFIKRVESKLQQIDEQFNVVINDSYQKGLKGFSIKVKATKRMHPHELLKITLELASDMKLSSRAIKFIKSFFDKLIDAEAVVHGIEPDKVHFHELATLDTCFDPLIFAFLADNCALFEKTIFLLPIAVGGGNVKTEHGLLSVPAPATLEIIRKNKLSIKGGPTNRELLTPTGAAILASLPSKQIQFLPNLKIDHVGYGFGTLGCKDPEVMSFPLRILIGEINEDLVREDICILETDVDDVTGETIGYLYDVFFDEGLIKDLSIISTVTKKNRPGFLIRVIVDPIHIDVVTKKLIKELGSLGIRVVQGFRHVVPRKTEEITITLDNTSEKIRVKKAYLGSQQISSKIEYEDLKRIARSKNISLRQARKNVQKQIWKKK